MHVFQNEEQQYIETSVFLSHTWRDRRLTWNPEGFHDVDSLRPPANMMWTPDITLYNK
jgi:hypothetical protein